MNWANFIRQEVSKDYFKNLENFLVSEYSKYTIYPEIEKIFNAFYFTQPSETKVVIIGQDPYHEDGQAMGLAFSVPFDAKIPPSLRNIATEIIVAAYQHWIFMHKTIHISGCVG